MAAAQTSPSTGDPNVADPASGLVIFAIVGAALILIGPLFIYLGMRARKKAEAATAWPVVPGEIISSEVVQRGHGQTRRFEAVVLYRYAVAGRDYEGRRIGFGSPQQTTRPPIVKIVDGYPPGAKVEVRHDPADPSSAVIETSAAGGVTQMILGGMIAVFGLAILGWALIASM